MNSVQTNPHYLITILILSLYLHIGLLRLLSCHVVDANLLRIFYSESISVCEVQLF